MFRRRSLATREPLAEKRPHEKMSKGEVRRILRTLRPAPSAQEPSKHDNGVQPLVRLFRFVGLPAQKLLPRCRTSRPQGEPVGKVPFFDTCNMPDRHQCLMVLSP